MPKPDTPARTALIVVMSTAAAVATIPATLLVFGSVMDTGSAPIGPMGWASMLFLFGLLLVVFGATGNAVGPPDERFGIYQAEQRKMIRRTAPRVWRAGAVLAAAALVIRFI